MLCTRPTNCIIVAAVLSFGLSSAAVAGERRERGMDVDFESLKGEVWRADGEWVLEVRYEIEIEDRLPRPGELTLVICIRDGDELLLNEEGTPFELIVPLDRPSEVDDDEIEFEDRFIVVLPNGAIRDPGHMRLEAAIVSEDDGHAVEHRDSSVKFRKPSHRRHIGIGIGVGVSTGCGVGVGVGIGF
ncbi:MAG: hypothetical protein JXO22_07265 [Phycisphaerae bacterium]|nr:hypothetical protein [Phycisphaerae bacterium]